jgi:hypothetical protein
LAIQEITVKEAEQFANMLLAGVPALTAVAYFFPEGTPGLVLQENAAAWVRKRAVTEAITKIQGKNWLSMDPQERIEIALKKHYADMAFYLMNNNYSDLDQRASAKADKCREALEKKMAGTAGSDDPMVKLYNDLLSGKLKLGAASTVPPAAFIPN